MLPPLWQAVHLNANEFNRVQGASPRGGGPAIIDVAKTLVRSLQEAAAGVAHTAMSSSSHAVNLALGKANGKAEEGSKQKQAL